MEGKAEGIACSQTSQCDISLKADFARSIVRPAGQQPVPELDAARKHLEILEV
jgi:hypothetical protein